MLHTTNIDDGCDGVYVCSQFVHLLIDRVQLGTPGDGDLRLHGSLTGNTHHQPLVLSVSLQNIQKRDVISTQGGLLSCYILTLTLTLTLTLSIYMTQGVLADFAHTPWVMEMAIEQYLFSLTE